jgi:hypothetical protein
VGDARGCGVAEVDSIRVYRGIYGGFSLAMSEAMDGVQFSQLPSSDEIARIAFETTREVIEADDRPTLAGAQQEFTAMTIVLAILEHQGKTDSLSLAEITPPLHGLWRLVGGQWPKR